MAAAASGSSSASSSLIPIDKLRGIDNYSSWKFMMKMTLIHEDLWDCVEKNEGDDRKKQKALAKIALAVHPAAIPHIRNAKTAEAWNNLQKAYEDKGLCRRLGLLRGLFATQLNKCASMETYLNKITDISQQLNEIGSPLEDDFVAVVMLSGLTSNYDPFIMAIENTNVKLSSDLVKGKLLQENLRRDDKSEVTALVARKQSKCFRCKKVGHFIKDCPSAAYKKKNTDASKALLTALSVNKNVWYIDSGATGHMCHDKCLMGNFVNDRSLEVKIANGEKLYTEGQGSVQVKMKNNKIKTISDVHYVPKLTANLLSVSAMVQKGYKVVFDSSGCKIYDNKSVIASATLCDGVYQLDTVEATVNCNFLKNTSSVSESSSVELNLVESGMSCSGLAENDQRTVKSCAMTTTAKRDGVTQDVWHRRLGHLNHRSMDLLKRELPEEQWY